MLSAGAQTEVTYLSGLTAGGTIAATSFWTWNYNTPATYSSFSDAAKWGSSTPGTSGGTVAYWFDTASGWTATEKAALQSGLALWSALANIGFAQASSAGAASFVFYEGGDGSAYQGGVTSTKAVGSTTMAAHTAQAYISIDADVPGFGPLGGSFGAYGGYPYQTVLHEIGHLLGLGHGGGYNGSFNPATQQFSAYDTRLWTIMSYINPWTSSAKYFSSYPVTGTNWGVSPDGYYYVPTTPMILDIAAIQQIYGAATSGPLAAGGVTFGFNSNIAASIKAYFDFTVNSHPVISIWAGGTNNTLDLSGWSSAATINLNPGTFSSAGGMTNNIGIADSAVVDKAVGGSGADSFIGSALDNSLTGKGGSDTIDGAGGSDTAVYSGTKAQYQITQNADGSIRVADLRSGAPDGTDTVRNVEFFQFSDGTYTVASLFNAAPVVTVPDPNVQAASAQPIALSTLVSASDPDGDAFSYVFYDFTSAGGHFEVSGVAKPAGTIFAVAASQLSQVTFVAGPGSSDDLLVGASDGKVFSGWSSLHIDGPTSVNSAPIVTVPNANVQATSTQPIALSTLASATDPDGDSFSYLLYDATQAGGYFVVSGVAKAAGTILAVPASQLSQVTFVPAPAGGSDDVLIGATDGKVFSGWSSLHIDGPVNAVNHAPVVTVPNASVQATTGQTLQLSGLVGATDADNDPFVYLFYDSTAGGGHFEVGGVAKPEGQIFAVSAAQLAQVTFIAGAGMDDLLVGASDGKAFSGWSDLHIL